MGCTASNAAVGDVVVEVVERQPSPAVLALKAELAAEELPPPQKTQQPPPPPTGEAGRRSFHQEFELSGKLGKGAFAQVYSVRRAGHSGDSERLAVKVMDLRVDRSSRPLSDAEEVDPKRKAAVESEVAILRKVANAKQCIRLASVYMEGCFSYIVMERCDRSLLQALEGVAVLNESTVKVFLREMIESLATIHALGVVHRDVKPDNFLCVGERSTVKLCDFGLASVWRPHLTGVYGTPPFMSPEMLSSLGYDSQTDVWSFGVIAYVLLLGQFPYRPAEPSGKAMKAAIKAGVPEPSFRPKARLESTDGTAGVSPAAQRFLAGLLTRKPDARPTAEAAFRDVWLQDEALDPQAASSLRPMLNAARRAGAFDAPRPTGDKDKNGIDTLMTELQATRCRSSGVACDHSQSGKGPLSNFSTEVGSMCTSGASSSDFHAPGILS